eukprot:CAMPEP_0115201348 /NCGR_PEP_ID=MMETSP0270-20121206/17578_1 /TAXON_ID=71861 /ORGANISM="Scrippsiella trochoidea, Strain CCMP3099" /LENGTH=608 /DNA_ID=CAMNT_0002614755 /DNA_START=120 /DNA_END=1946 /DNA_ORIENTATION=-
MPLSKSKSLPGIMMLGTTMPKGIDGSFARKNTLSFKLTHGPVDKLQPPPSPMTAADKLAGSRELSRPSSAVALEDVIPRNMRHPRVAPAWLKHDKQVLRFYGFFQETVTERVDENSRYRHVKFMFYMEDGTLQMSEPKVENSGIPQGAFLKRHRVPRADGVGFIGPDDFRCGGQITVYGRTYHIAGCDRFTRWFYEENGIDVGEDEPMVEDTWQKSYKFGKTAEKGGLPPSYQAMDAKTLTKFQVGQPPANKKFMQFLLNDRKVLRFKAYWDDPTLYGGRIYFIIHYFLSDNTVEVNEAHSRNSGRDAYPVFYKRGPMYKKNKVNAYPGMLVSDGGLYMPEDFKVGDSISVWGRDVVLYDCDDFTQKFYKEYMDVDQKQMTMDVSEKPLRHIKLAPPPHNGIGTEQDSLINCHMIQPKPPKVDLAKLMSLSGESLRFEAKMANGEPEDECRRFVIAFFPDTDRVAVYELQQRNSGHMAGKFREKSRLKNPATGKYFEMKDFYVGTTVNICAQPLQIIRADEHALQFLEANCDHFPYADPSACAVRLQPLAGEPEMQDERGIEPDRLKELAAERGVSLVDHEVITLLRKFGMDTDSGPVICGPRALEAC